MASELYIQQVVGSAYIVGTANETGIAAGKAAYFYKFPARYGGVDIYGYTFRVDGVATANAGIANTVPAAVISVFGENEENYLNGYWVAPANEIYGTTIGLAGQAVLDTPIRVELNETVNVGFPDFAATAEVGGWSLYSTFMFQSVDH